MALNATLVFEVRNSGNDANAGAYDAAVAGAGVDYSQQTTPQVTVDNSAITATTAGAASNVITFTAGYTPSANDVGNTYQASGGTNINVGLYVITGYTGTTWTVSGAQNLTGAGGAGAALTGRMGGCMATPGQAWKWAVGGNVVHWQYNVTASLMTSSTANVGSGALSLPAGTASRQTRLIGYQTTRGDGGSKPILRASAVSSFTMCTLGALCILDNIELDGASLSGARAISAGANVVHRCRIRNMTNGAIIGNSSTLAEWVEATGCTAGIIFSGGCYRYCCAHNNSSNATIFALGSNHYACFCAAVNNAGGTSALGFAFSSAGPQWAEGCLAYGNGGDGFRAAGTGTVWGIFENCLSAKNTGYGFLSVSATDNVLLSACATWSNTGGDFYTTFSAASKRNCVAIAGTDPTNDPFTNKGAGDFSINAVAGAGALLRAMGMPAASGLWMLPGLSTPSYPDIGVAQHVDPNAVIIVEE